MAHTGAMIAAKLRDEDAERLAVENGEPVDELHLTLLFLGEAAAIPEDTRDRILNAVATVAEKMNTVNVEAFAVSVFNPPGVTRADGMDRDTCVTALVSDPSGDLVTLRGAVEEIFLGEALGFEMPEQHSPWQPHVTLAYVETTDVAPYVDRVGPLVVDGIRVAFGGDVYDIPLGDDEISQVESHSEALLSDVDVDDFGEIIVPNVLLDLRGDVDSFQRERDLSAPGPGGHNLRNYWVRGKGAAKIRWGIKGSMRRCIRQLRKYVRDPGGLCAEYHKRATGEWPRGGLIPSGEESIALGITAGGDSWRHQVRAPRGTPIGGQWVDEINGEISWKWTRGEDVLNVSKVNGNHSDGDVVGVRSDNNAFMRWNAERGGYDISKRRGLGESWDFEQISQEDAQDRVLGETGEEWFEPEVTPLAEDDDGLDGLVESVSAPTDDDDDDSTVVDDSSSIDADWWSSPGGEKLLSEYRKLFNEDPPPKPGTENEPEDTSHSFTGERVSADEGWPDPGSNARFDLKAQNIEDSLVDAGYTREQAARVQKVNQKLAERYGGNFNQAMSVDEYRQYDPNVSHGIAARLGFMPDNRYALVVQGGIPDDMLTSAHDHGEIAGSNIEGVATHEAAHAILPHVSAQGDFFPGKRASSYEQENRTSDALNIAYGAAEAAGMPRGPRLHPVSTYASKNGIESEAEMFTEYHWGGADREPWVIAWGEAFHNALGLDPTPFSEDW